MGHVSTGEEPASGTLAMLESGNGAGDSCEDQQHDGYRRNTGTVGPTLGAIAVAEISCTAPNAIALTRRTAVVLVFPSPSAVRSASCDTSPKEKPPLQMEWWN